MVIFGILASINISMRQYRRGSPYSYGDSEEDAIEKLQYDLYYMKNMSPLFDLQIIFESLKVVLLGKGAR
jgi:lipopolysaccharide/colanic/teichoic acid biosynthesis glycosyltransferase